jgi:hypothetical protein
LKELWTAAVHAEITLDGASRLETLHLAFSSSHHLMRVLGAIVSAKPLLMRAGQSQRRRNAAAEERSLSVTSNFGTKPCFFRNLRISLSAARPSRRR